VVSQTGTPADPWTTWVPAFIAAGAAIAAVIINVWWQRRIRKDDRLSRQKQESADLCRKQLDQLYGEMLILRSTSYRLSLRLRGDDPAFRLIDNIAAIKGDPDARRRRVVEQILKINARLAKLIETRASLLTEFPPPESFLAFLDHQRALATLWEMGVNVEADGREPSFPGSLDDDVKKAIGSIQAKLRDLGQ
jgi:hypothetical protein